MKKIISIAVCAVICTFAAGCGSSAEGGTAAGTQTSAQETSAAVTTVSTTEEKPSETSAETEPVSDETTTKTTTTAAAETVSEKKSDSAKTTKTTKAAKTTTTEKKTSVSKETSANKETSVSKETTANKETFVSKETSADNGTSDNKETSADKGTADSKETADGKETSDSKETSDNKETTDGKETRDGKETPDGKETSDDKETTDEKTTTVSDKKPDVTTTKKKKPAGGSNEYDGSYVYKGKALETVGDILSVESEFEIRGCEGNVFVCGFDNADGSVRARAKITDKERKAIESLDPLFDEDYDERVLAVLKDAVIYQLEDLSVNKPPQSELDKLVGKTGQQIYDMGYKYIGNDTQELVYWLSKGDYQFSFYVTSVPDITGFDVEWDEEFKNLTIKSVQYNGLSLDALMVGM